MICVLYGNEPYEIKKQISLFLDGAEPVIDYAEFNVFSEAVVVAAMTRTVMGDRMKVVLHCGSIDKNLATFLEGHKDIEMLIEVSSDPTKVLKKLSGVQVKECNKCSFDTLMRAVVKRLEKQFSRQEIETSYVTLKNSFQRYEIDDLYDMSCVIRDVDILIASQDLSDESIQFFCPPLSKKEKAYMLSEYLLNCDRSCYSLIHDLQDESPLGLLAIVSNSVGICYKASCLKRKGMGNAEILKKLGVTKFQLKMAYEKYEPKVFMEIYHMLQEACVDIKKGADSKVVLLSTFGKAMKQLK